MLEVGLLFGDGEGGDAGGGGRFYDSVEVEVDGIAGLLAEVREVEGGLAVLPPDAGDELANLDLWGDGVDVDNIVWAGFGGIEAGSESEGDAKAVGSAAGELHHRQGTTGKKQGGIVDADGAVFVHEVGFVEA